MNVRHRGRVALGAILCWVMSSVRHKPALRERHFAPVLMGWIVVYFVEVRLPARKVVLTVCRMPALSRTGARRLAIR